MAPTAPVFRFRQLTVTSGQVEAHGDGSVAKVTVPGASDVAVGVRVVSDGRPKHANTVLRQPSTNLTGTWNTVVDAAGTGGGFAVAAADGQSGTARTATDAAARATNER
ncbi:conserved hypothetical protein [Rhodococcus sp. RD6.2]|nr:conserved hypothetical protein [Rhodococcus sp. RD6.2]